MKEKIISLSYIGVLIVLFVLVLSGIIHYPLFFTIAIPVILIYLTYYLVMYTRQRNLTRQRLEDKLQEIEEKREANPGKTKYSWDIARIKLESYFDRNLSRSRCIFWISIAVMLSGFAFIIWGVLISVGQPEVLSLTYLTSVAGIVTEFIGATFMVVYRSTINQATESMNVLERINQVGMAIQIIESIPESEKGLQSEARVEISKILLSKQLR
ncbi:MAG: hypothetical protein U5N26_09140 [Candidatus Marinimicrobia bacterium]|nr:hypothetical protein [Candidatus Neomarinimicrobiota bacterium]